MKQFKNWSLSEFAFHQWFLIALSKYLLFKKHFVSRETLGATLRCYVAMLNVNFLFQLSRLFNEIVSRETIRYVVSGYYAVSKRDYAYFWLFHVKQLICFTLGNHLIQFFWLTRVSRETLGAILRIYATMLEVKFLFQLSRWFNDIVSRETI